MHRLSTVPLALTMSLVWNLRQAQTPAEPAAPAPTAAPAAAPAPTPAAPPKASLLERPQPSVNDLPNDDYGKLARYGHELSTRTFAYIGPEVKDKKMRYTGNNLARW